MRQTTITCRQESASNHCAFHELPDYHGSQIERLVECSYGRQSQELNAELSTVYAHQTGDDIAIPDMAENHAVVQRHGDTHRIGDDTQLSQTWKRVHTRKRFPNSPNWRWHCFSWHESGCMQWYRDMVILIKLEMTLNFLQHDRGHMWWYRDRVILTKLEMTLNSSRRDRGRMWWYKNMVIISGDIHCCLLLPTTGGSPKATMRNEGLMGKIFLYSKYTAVRWFTDCFFNFSTAYSVQFKKIRHNIHWNTQREE